MALKIVPNQTGGLKEFPHAGGLGEIYTTPSNKLIKIYQFDDDNEATKTHQRLKKLGENAEIYQPIERFCATPEMLVEDQDKKRIIGFQMKHFENFQPIKTLLDKQHCISNHYTIRVVTNIFLALHDHLCRIHDAGFIIGDFNHDNIMFKLENRTVHIVFVDIDSWAVPKLLMQASAITEDFCHPELEKDHTKLAKYHDWYSYAILLARSLIKDNPFNAGTISDAEMKKISQTDLEKITCWDHRVNLKKEETMYIRRFGKKLTDTLMRWLKGDERGIFPKIVLKEFIMGLVFCKGTLGVNKQCKLEVHIDHVNCPRCSAKLKAPNNNGARPVTKNKTAPAAKNVTAKEDQTKSMAKPTTPTALELLLQSGG